MAQKRSTKVGREKLHSPFVNSSDPEVYDDWKRAVLVQRYVISQAPFADVSPGEVEAFWEMGLLEKVEGLAESELVWVEGWELTEARSALRMKTALERTTTVHIVPLAPEHVGAKAWIDDD